MQGQDRTLGIHILAQDVCETAAQLSLHSSSAASLTSHAMLQLSHKRALVLYLRAVVHSTSVSATATCWLHNSEVCLRSAAVSWSQDILYDQSVDSMDMAPYVFAMCRHVGCADSVYNSFTL